MAGGLSYPSGRDMPPGMQIAAADKIIERIRRSCDQLDEAIQKATQTPSVAAPVLSNGDRIRAMSDEQLVDFINNFNICDNRSNAECKTVFLADCQACVLDWLQAPAKEVP